MKRLGIALAAVAVASFCLGPLSFQWFTSLRGASAGDSWGGGHERFTLGNYGTVFRAHPFARVLANSFLVATLTTLLAIGIGASAAFALARLPVRGKRALLAVSLAISMFPPIATVSPLYLLLRALHLRDRALALVIPYTTFALPLAMWLLTSFFRQIPEDLYRAARVDGCSAFGAFRRVILPLAAPGLASTAILVFIAAWNELLYALTFVSAPLEQTVPVTIALFSAEHEQPWGEIAAASTIAMAPLIVLTVLFQKRIVAGLTAGAVKG